MTTNKKKEFKLENGYCSNCLAVPIELNYRYVLKDDCKCSCHKNTLKEKIKKMKQDITQAGIDSGGELNINNGDFEREEGYNQALDDILKLL